jgi:hypothetical protein
MRIILCLLLIACFSACQQNAAKNFNTSTNANTNSQIQEQKEREATFASFQKYIDAHYPNWKVKGIRKEDSDCSEEGEKNFNYVLLTNGKTEKTIVIVSATFELADGKIEKHLFEPDKQTLKRNQNRKIRERNIEEGKEAILDEIKEQSFENSYDPSIDN